MTGGTPLSMGVSSDVMAAGGSWFPGGIVDISGYESLRLPMILLLLLLFDFRVESKPHHSRRIQYKNCNLASSYGTGNTPFLYVRCPSEQYQ